MCTFSLALGWFYLFWFLALVGPIPWGLALVYTLLFIWLLCHLGGVGEFQRPVFRVWSSCVLSLSQGLRFGFRISFWLRTRNPTRLAAEGDTADRLTEVPGEVARGGDVA